MTQMICRCSDDMYICTVQFTVNCPAWEVDSRVLTLACGYVLWSLHSKHDNTVLPGSEFMQVMIGALHMDLGSVSCTHALDVDMTIKLKNAVLNC